MFVLLTSNEQESKAKQKIQLNMYSSCNMSALVYAGTSLVICQEQFLYLTQRLPQICPGQRLLRMFTPKMSKINLAYRRVCVERIDARDAPERMSKLHEAITSAKRCLPSQPLYQHLAIPNTQWLVLSSPVVGNSHRINIMLG